MAYKVDGIRQRLVPQPGVSHGWISSRILVSLGVMVGIIAVSGLLTAKSVLAARAERSVLTFPADVAVLQQRQQIKADLQQRLLVARQEKQAQFEAAAKSVTPKALPVANPVAPKERLVAANRQQSSQRAASKTTSVAKNSSGSAGSLVKVGTAYTPDPRENGGSHVTATGENLTGLLDRGEKVVASNDFPLGTQIKIKGKGWYTVKDRMARGGKVDFLVRTNKEANDWGRRQVVIEEVKLPKKK